MRNYWYCGSVNLRKQESPKFLENELTKLLCFAMSQAHFYFDGKIFDQVDEVANGVSLRTSLG